VDKIKEEGSMHGRYENFTHAFSRKTEWNLGEVGVEG